MQLEDGGAALEGVLKREREKCGEASGAETNCRTVLVVGHTHVRRSWVTFRKQDYSLPDGPPSIDRAGNSAVGGRLGGEGTRRL